MPQHLLVVTLGPVQDFIASARRCQDLWFGSWLLSDLSRAVAKAIDDSAVERTLIFPNDPRGKEVAVANKIVALLPANCDPEEAAKAGRAALDARLGKLAERIFRGLPPNDWDRDLATRQLEDVIEYAWVTAPVDDRGYDAARTQAEALLGARKSTKNWKPVPWKRENRSKCSIDGERESVLDDSLYTNKMSDFRRRFKVKKSERICGVCLLKRLGQDLAPDKSDVSFPREFHSNSHVTAQPIFNRVKTLKETGENAARVYAEALADREIGIDFDAFPHLRRESGLEGYLLFEDRLADAFESYAPSYNAKTKDEQATTLAKVRQALHTFFKAIGHEREPTPYYAMLLADGDQMGVAINELKKVEKHRQLSRALETFALGCDDIVKEHSGSPIYSGGDDVLALLPLHKALDCANALQKSFRETLEKYGPPLSKVPTLSVGLGIAHHLEAMTEVRALAKDAEKLAKKERNSLAIVMSKRSGGTTEVTGTWNEPEPLHERIARWCKLFAAEKLPDGVAFELEEAMAPFEMASAEERLGFKEVILSLVKRILGRKRAERGNSDLDEETITRLMAVFGNENDPVEQVQRLSRELQIARLVHAACASASASVEVKP